MTALLLICATLLGQSQAAQLHATQLDNRSRQELNQQNPVDPLLRAQLRILASVDLFSLMQDAGQSVILQYQSAGLPEKCVVAQTDCENSGRQLLLLAEAQPRSP